MPDGNKFLLNFCTPKYSSCTVGTFGITLYIFNSLQLTVDTRHMTADSKNNMKSEFKSDIKRYIKCDFKSDLQNCIRSDIKSQWTGD